MTHTADPLSRIDAARTFLFVPGNRPDRFGKAVASGADIVVIDLEDAIALDSKLAARAAVAAWLSPEKPVMVRINGCGTPWFEEDLALARSAGVLGIMLPKAEPGRATCRVAEATPTVALIETAIGVANITKLAHIRPGIRRLALGELDLSVDLGVTAGGTVLDPVRLQMLVASRVAGLAPPIEGVSVDTDDMNTVERDARRAQALGFSAKLAIHPRQLNPILTGLRPTSDQIDRARSIVEADAASGGSAVSLCGQMVDKPLVERARQLLATIGENV